MVGFTGVVWFPRGATRMSAELYAGPGPVPLTGASASWTALTEALGETAATVGAVLAGLTATWQGPAADTALLGLGRFEAWLVETTAHAGRAAGVTGVGAGAYTASALVMPSPAEIAATAATVTAATVASAATGGAALGAAAATAEAAQRELDLRATVAMEGYEAASVPLSVVEPFPPPPPIGHAEAAETSAATRAAHAALGDGGAVRDGQLAGTHGPSGPATAPASAGAAASPGGSAGGPPVTGLAQPVATTPAGVASGPLGAGPGGAGAGIGLGGSVSAAASGAGLAGGAGAMGAGVGGAGIRSGTMGADAARPAILGSGGGAAAGGGHQMRGGMPMAPIGARSGVLGAADPAETDAATPDGPGRRPGWDDGREVTAPVLGALR